MEDYNGRKPPLEIFIISDDSEEEVAKVVPAVKTEMSPPTVVEQEPVPVQHSPTEGCENQFKKLLATCRKLTTNQGDITILDRIETKFAAKCALHPKPLEFASFLATVEEKVLKEPVKVFVHVNEVITEIKAWKKRGDTVGPNDQQEEPNGSRPSGPLPASKKHVKRLEHSLRDLSRRIKEMEEEEVSLEDLDDEDSTYIQLDRFKKRYVLVWQKLCDIAGRSHSTGRAADRKFQFQASRYPEVNRRVEVLVRRCKECFPDYQDVHKIVFSENLKSQLHLTSRQVDNVAKDIFLDVMAELKKRRMTDDYNVLGGHLTENLPEDPANQDENLRRVLEVNYEEGCKRIDKVLEEYTQMELEVGRLKDEANDGKTDVTTAVDTAKEEPEKSPRTTETVADAKTEEATVLKAADDGQQDTKLAIDQMVLTTTVTLGSLTADYLPKRKLLSRDRGQAPCKRYRRTWGVNGPEPSVADSDDDVVILD